MKSKNYAHRKKYMGKDKPHIWFERSRTGNRLIFKCGKRLYDVAVDTSPRRAYEKWIAKHA